MLINQTQTKLAIGLMSGTSLDGIDATLLKSDGHTDIEVVANLYHPYSDELIGFLREIINSDTVSVSRLAELQYSLTLLHIDIVQQFLEQNSLKPSDVDIIGFHGQTIYHAPELATSWQLGLPDLLAQQTGIDVVFDFRSRDVARGGQGAPLVPIFHKALLRNEKASAAILNIGGIANITLVNDGNIIASDIGPGNQLINDLCAKFFDVDYDYNGEIAASNTHDQLVIDQIMDDAFFTRPFPKSLDRSHFAEYQEYFLPEAPGVAVATATHLTAQSIAKFLRKCEVMPSIMYCAGGGVKNKYLMSLLSELLGDDIKLADTSQLGFDTDFVESSAFAYLAIRTILHEASTYPTTTGTRFETIVGNLIRS